MSVFCDGVQSRCRERRSAFPTKITLNDIGVYKDICVNVDYLSNSFSISFIFHASRFTFSASFLLPTSISFVRLHNCFGGENELVGLSYLLYAHELRNWGQPRVSRGNHQQAG